MKKNIFQYFVDSITTNYANFSGRARRKEYWSTVLLSFLIFAFVFVEGDVLAGKYHPELLFGTAAFFFLPILSASVRRMHDIGKSGTNLLFYFLPVIGGFWVLILLLTESNYGTNRYGRNPKKPALGEEIDQIGEE